MKTASVWVKGTNFSFDRVYEYVLDDDMKAQIGCRAVVPFGKGEKLREALIVKIKDSEADDNEAASKPAADGEASAGSASGGAAISETTQTPELKTIVKIADSEPILSAEAIETARYIKAVTLCTYYDAVKCFLPAGETVNLTESTNTRRKAKSDDQPETIKTEPDTSEFVLNSEQAAAFEGINSLIKSGKPSASLLYGVTGSGKTAVFIKLIEETVKAGMSVILLVPEIALTPQMTARFTQIFGERVSVLHSGFTPSKRAKEFYRIKSGGADIIIGTRSAVFAPAVNIGLIILDEEAEHTYISESTPRYSAREVAKKRCVMCSAALLLASATPSIESYYFAEIGRYNLFTLKNRFSKEDKLPLPEVEIVDIYRDSYYADSTVFSEKLVTAIYENIKNGEQTILLLNRRGFNTTAVCRSCKGAILCPNCSIPLTFHRDGKKLLCHYCGHTEMRTDTCPKCGGGISFIGTGTQKIEEELNKFFGEARILRMDADTITDRDAYERGFTAFGNGEYDIMIGTQMVAKGLDFPNVTLSAVISADAALYNGDFRSFERTFSLLTQVMGRSGRGKRPGRAIIQTGVPDHYIMGLAAAQDYIGFYKEEIEARKLVLYPPFCDLCKITFISGEKKLSENAAEFFAESLRDVMREIEKADFPLRILGPAPEQIEKINNKYRYGLLLKTRFTASFKAVISKLYALTYTKKKYAKTVVTIDFN
jgi:primosomal protein N' (replication factor Y)